MTTIAAFPLYRDGLPVLRYGNHWVLDWTDESQPRVEVPLRFFWFRNYRDEGTVLSSYVS